MRILADTNVISELQKPSPDARLVAFFDHQQGTDTFLSVMTIGEIQYGLIRMPTGRRKTILEDWLNRLKQSYGNRILPIDLGTSELWAEIAARLHAHGENISMTDSLLAATAMRHGLHLATRNVRHFISTGVLVVNPWQE